jgi:hypothetical protein
MRFWGLSIMHKRTAAIGLILMVACGCASSPSTDEYESALKDKTMKTQSAYQDCMYAVSEILVPMPVSSRDAGIAAQAKCSPEFSDYELAAREWFVGIVSSESKFWARDRADQRVQEVKQKLQESVVENVVEGRMESARAKSPAQVPKPKSAPATIL